MHGRAYAYHLDPKSSPRHCDLTVHPGAAPFHVSYTFQTDVLIVALAMRDCDPYPATFEPGAWLALYAFRRATDKDLQKPRPLSNEEKAAWEDLRHDITETEALLETEKYREFFSRPLDRQQRERMEKEPGAFEKAIQYMKENHVGPKLAKLLRLGCSGQPTFDSSKTTAAFDIRTIHVERVAGASRVVLRQARQVLAVDRHGIGSQVPHRRARSRLALWRVGRSQRVSVSRIVGGGTKKNGREARLRSCVGRLSAPGADWRMPHESRPV